MRSASPPVVLMLALLPPAGLAQQLHKFPDHGFKITAPANWTLIPPRPGEQWILAHFMCDREYTYRDPVSGMTSTHRPRMRVFGFPKRDSPVEVEVVKTESRVETSFRYPYRDYADYLKRHDHGGGYFVASTEDMTLGGLSVTKEEVKIEKLTPLPRRLLVCIYHLPERDLAVETEILETLVSDLSEEMYRSIKSLVVTGEAKKPEGTTSRPGPDPFADNPKERAKKRDERRRAWRERVLADVQKSLPKGWTSRKTKAFLIL